MKADVRDAVPVMIFVQKQVKIWKINDVAHVLDLRYCHVCTICAMACPEHCIKIIRNAPEE